MSSCVILDVMDKIFQLTLHINSHFVQRFPFKRGHSGILKIKFAPHFNLYCGSMHLGRVAKREEHHQLLIFGTSKQPSQCGATIERGAGWGTVRKWNNNNKHIMQSTILFSILLMPNSGNLVLFFGRQKQRSVRNDRKIPMMIMTFAMIINYDGTFHLRSISTWLLKYMDFVHVIWIQCPLEIFNNAQFYCLPSWTYWSQGCSDGSVADLH